MSDGGGESGRQSENEPRKGPAGDEFGRAIARIAVAQICESVGFQGFQQSALEALSDIAIRYLRDLGKTAHFYANLAGRTDCNVFDIFRGLEDLVGPTQGFTGASDVNHCLLGSGTVREITQYVDYAEEIPFVRPIPRFPVVRAIKTAPSFAQLGEAPPAKHIPDWLPALPDPHTYVHTPVWNDRTTDPKTDKTQQAKQRRKAEKSLLSLQQRLANGSSAQASVDPIDAGKAKRVMEANPFLAPPLQPSVDPIDVVKAKWVMEANPFLAPPLQASEKDVSPLTLPEKLASEGHAAENLSVLETFAPAIEAAKCGVSENVENEWKILPNKRPTVHFKFGIHKKSVATPLASRPSSASEKMITWFGRDDEKDDKKRRAELILKEAMENPQELAQL
ncbi:transcription initiation factor TFIID subunit 8-like [Aristolochia californica]|uniref:transcription initiation factor TFIID subunit 8-like n=1 Tax=Aristolochia californica TaxID=171875 RepID=UPI0035D7D44E